MVGEGEGNVEGARGIVGVRGEGRAHRNDSMPFKPPVPC